MDEKLQRNSKKEGGEMMRKHDQVLKGVVIALCTALLIAGFGISLGHAARYPSKPVTIIVPFNVGGSNDIGARTVQPYLKEALGARAVIVENKPGGAGAIGVAAAAKRRADGHTILYTGVDAMTMATLLVKNPGFKIADFVPVVMVTTDPRYFFVNKGSPYKTFDDLAKDARKRPGKVSVAAIPGTGGHFFLAWVMENLKLPFSFVGYPGGGPATTALLGGHIAAYCDAGTGRVGVRDKLRNLGTSMSMPTTQWPEGPSLLESKAFKDAGIKESPGFESAITTTMWVRKEVKAKYPDRYKKLVAAFDEVSKNKQFQAKAGQLGLDKVLVWLPAKRVEEIKASTWKVMTASPAILKQLKKK
jgi:tripartite-type tricarboxylate transporter receptor subunit TctC